MDIVPETWRPVVGKEDRFAVSDLGRVKALPWEMRHWCGKAIPQQEKIIKQSKHSGGYAVVGLRDGKKHFVHKLVMAAFVGEPKAGQDVNHIDGDKQNNQIKNLEYCDRLHNVRHAIATGLQDNSGEHNGMAKLTQSNVDEIRRMLTAGERRKAIAKRFGVTTGAIDGIASGRRWKTTVPDDWENPAA